MLTGRMNAPRRSFFFWTMDSILPPPPHPARRVGREELIRSIRPPFYRKLSALPRRLLQLHPMRALVGRALRRLPAVEQLRIKRMDFDAERAADGERVLSVGAPQRHREVTAGTG